MALFQFNDRTIPYHIHLGPFGFDLVLLQGSKFNSDFWRPVIEDLEALPSQGGRLLTCDWAEGVGESKAQDQAQICIRLLQTLGMDSAWVVAFDDAVKLLAEMQKAQSGLVEKTLLFPVEGPKGADLKRAVRDFCQIF